MSFLVFGMRPYYAYVARYIQRSVIGPGSSGIREFSLGQSTLVGKFG